MYAFVYKLPICILTGAALSMSVSSPYKMGRDGEWMVSKSLKRERTMFEELKEAPYSYAWIRKRRYH